MTQLPQRIYFRPNGEANSYALIDQDRIKWVMALLLNGEHVQDKQIEILERMAACWNACQNIETTVLEEHALGVISSEHSQQRNELLKALQAIVKSLADQDDEGMIEHAQQMIDARAAIAKTTGGTNV
jgi:hypothetical protein